MKMDDLKKVIAKLIRENFHQSISEATYDLGKKQYTDKNLTPTEILDLAMAYASTPANKMLNGKLGNMVNVANDLAKLNGTTQLDAKTRGKNPALILFLLKNKLVTKDEYVKLYKDLIEKQISVVKSLKNADPASRMVGGAAARAAHKDMKGEFDESVNEMSKNDVHFKEIMKMYDRGGSFTKKKVAVIVCRNSKASRSDIEEELLDTTYEDILQFQDELNIKESVEGDRIQKLNDRIKALRDKMNSTKSSTQKNLIQQRLKNALQTLTKIKSGLGIKKINNESVVKENILNEDLDALGLLIPALGALIGGGLAQLYPYFTGRPNIYTNIKDWWNSKKDNSEMNKIANRIKNDPDVQEFLKKKNKSGWKEMLKKKLTGSELNYLNKIYRSRFNNESVNEAASAEAMGIAALTGLRGDAVQKFIDDNNIHARKLFAYLKIKGPHTLSNRMDISTAIVGKANNKFAQGIIKAFSESKVNEAKSDYEVYHDSYTSAINAAKAYAEKKGYTINDDDSFTKIGMGPKKPSEGKTNRFSIELVKDNRVQKKMLQIQVYGMKNKYELNCYIG